MSDDQQPEKRRSLRALDWLNFFMADVETGIGPFLATFLSGVHRFNPAQVGMVVGAQNLAEVLTQIPAGFALDHVRQKKLVVIAAAVLICIGAILIVALPTAQEQMLNQIAMGMTAAFVSPIIAAISLGITGRRGFAHRAGRNGAFSHAGNVVSALIAGYIGYVAGQSWIFYTAAICGALVIGAAAMIHEEDIDYNSSRGLSSSQETPGWPPVRIFRETRLGIFLLVVLVFHSANSPMLPLAGQELAGLQHAASSIYMSACIVTAQLVMTPVSWAAGRLGDQAGRKRLYILAFVALIARGGLFVFARSPIAIIAIEALDGTGTAIASVIGLLIASDLAHGTGRFNFVQGTMQAAVGMGAFLGNLSAGMIAKSMGFAAAFSALTAVAGAGLVLFVALMPETSPGREE